MMNPLSLFYTIRSYVDAYAGFLGQRFLSLIWVVAIGVVIWFYGPLIALGEWRPLEPALHRMIAIGVLVALWLVWTVVGVVRGRRRDKAMVAELADGGEVSAEAEASAEVAALRKRLTEALTVLRKLAKRRLGYVYELPWYLIVGAPGSGKTTLLRNSGLQFPLGDALAAEPLEGVGGTRNCAWWFAEEAILIDTAGRYTTHADFKGTDKAGWLGFLKLLKKHRASQPVNGILVTLSLADIVGQKAEDRLTELRAIRQRLAETADTLRARVPVYVILTKADLLTGFGEFFDALSKSDREQVWGTTFDLRVGGAGRESVPDAFAREYDLLLRQLQTLLVERLQQEPDLETRGRMFKFPAEVAGLKDALVEVIIELSSGSRLVEPPFIRGVYLTSGTQDPVAATDGASARSILRSYFLTRLFSGVLFEEAALVARDVRLMRRRRTIKRLSYAATGLCLVLALAAFVGAYVRHAVALDAARAAMTAYNEMAAGIPTADVADHDFLRVLPALDALAAARDEFGGTLASFTLDLGMADVVERQHDAAYRRALDALLLPRLLVAAADVLRDGAAEQRAKFEALKLYMMLGALGPMDTAYVADRTQELFANLYPGAGREPARAALSRHVAALVAAPVTPIALDPELIAAARRQVADRTLAERAYDALRGSAAVRAVHGWRPSEVLTSNGEQAFVRVSGGSLRDGIDGLFTATGARTVVVPGLAAAAEAALAEDWVRGAENDPGRTASDIAQDAAEIYFNEFTETWRAYLADMRVRPADSLVSASEVARALASAPAPFEQLARSIAEVTDIVGARGVVSAAAASADPAAAANPGAADRASALAVFAASPVDIADAPDPYADLRRALAPGDDKAASAIEAFQKPLADLYGQLSRVATSSADVIEIFRSDGALSEANQRLVEEGRRLPPPLDGWAAGFAADVARLAVAAARDSVTAQWAATGATECAAAVDGHFPFDPNGTQEVSAADFKRLFGPGGVLDSFFAQKLAPFVDTSQTPWAWRGGLGTEAVGTKDVSLDALAEFQRARQIRDMFFPGGAGPAFSFELDPVGLTDDADAVQLELGSQMVTYFHGPQNSRTITWPDPSGESTARLGFLPGGWLGEFSAQGFWAPLRLLASAKVEPLGGGRLRATFVAGTRQAQFDVAAGAVQNPFDFPALREFKCPAAL